MGELEKQWLENEKFKEKHIKQVFAWVDNLELEKRKEEIRKLFSIVPISQIEKYITECVNDSFEEKGFIFQDLVNELGRRLSYKVTFGIYKGVKGKNGFDGLWESNGDHAFVVESKVTDAFAIELDKIYKYRQKLIEEGKILEQKSSIIIVLGRKDVNNIPGIIRGSKYKWDTILIGVNALIELVKEREKRLDKNNLDKKILHLLKMEDNVEADELVNLLITENTTTMNTVTNSNKPIVKKSIRKENINFYKQCVDKIYEIKKIKLCKKEGKTKVMYEDENKENGIIIINSDTTKHRNYDSYWFAFHEKYFNSLEEYNHKYIALGCGSENNILLVPIKFMKENLNKLKKTEKNNRRHWHIYIKYQDNKFLLSMPLDSQRWKNISEYHI